MKEPFPAKGMIFPRMPDSLLYREMHKDWVAKRGWCEQQGWKLGDEFIAPGAFDCGWYFKEQKHAVLFALRWA